MENLNLSKDEKINLLLSLKIENVSKIYTGGNNCCRCGCKGDYHYVNDMDEKKFYRYLKTAIRYIKNENYFYTNKNENNKEFYIDIAGNENSKIGSAITFYCEIK